jgi:hypothetical protein
MPDNTPTGFMPPMAHQIPSRYRAERGLSQAALARLLGWRQPVARLEAAEHNPTMTPCSPWPASSACGCRWVPARRLAWSPR